MPFQLPEEEKILKELSYLAIHDRESFRAQAQDAYKNYTRDDRLSLQQLETQHTTAYDTLLQWKQTLQPLMAELHAQRLKPSFSKTIAKYLALRDDEAEVKADALIEERFVEVREQSILALYPFPGAGKKDSAAHARTHARQLLSLPEAEIEILYITYSNYLLYRHVAALHTIAVIDQWSNWWHRQLTAQKIKKERKAISQTEDSRLLAIDDRLAELSAMNNGLVGDIIAREWDILTVLNLRHQYEKQLHALSFQQSQNSLQHFALFEKTIKTFRDAQLATHSTTEGLSAVMKDADDTTLLLIRIFELSNSEKNQLLLLMKEVRELSKEKAQILETRAHRRMLLQA
jgi:hypothetical protein